MNLVLESSWNEILLNEFQKPYFIELVKYINIEYSKFKCFPPENQIFEAFNKTKLKDVKVVILGQDPYHGLNQAHGLCFSVPDGISLPPSLKNIFKELESDVKCVKNSGNLTSWTSQGVFLLNSTLTVREAQAGSHQNQGWERFTDEIIKLISTKKENVVFILWGSYAHKKSKLIDQEKHLVIKGVHPSPLSSYRGFFGSKPFSKTNEYLIKHQLEPIIW